MDTGALIETVAGSQIKNESCFPSLTLRQRLTGWAVCTGIGNSDRIRSLKYT